MPKVEVYSVVQVTAYLRQLLDSDALLRDLWVSGEISNLSESAAGHLYFTLKDASSQLRCVLFRRARLGLPVTNGSAVVAHGRISIYEVTGNLQFYVDMVQPQGLGALHLEFELLKARLEEEGLFEAARKRPLPAFPQRIGVVTSPYSAVWHDIINIVGRRYPLVELVLCPTPVQGDGAVEGIVRSLETLNGYHDIDVIIVARGGGSLEELWAFNEEEVARAIYASRIPVISGVGHDTDFTIADFVADARAPTPSAAAEMAVPDQAELRLRLSSLARSLATSLEMALSQDHNRLNAALGRLRSLRPDLARHQQHLYDLAKHASTYLGNMLALRRERVRGSSLQLASLNPQATLERGYALVQRADTGSVVSRVEQLERGDGIEVRVSNGSFRGRVTSLRKGVQAWLSNFPSSKR